MSDSENSGDEIWEEISVDSDIGFSESRTTFLDADGNYEGFRYPDLDEL